MFETIEEKVEKVPTEKRLMYAKTMNGIDVLTQIENYLEEKRKMFLGCKFEEDCWINMIIEMTEFYKVSKTYVELGKLKQKSLICGWIEGKSYEELQSSIGIDMYQLEEICQDDMGYSLNLLLSCVIELIEQYRPKKISARQWNIFIGDISFFQQRIKYGLLDSAEIAAYEFGFADRIIARKVAKFLYRYGEQTIEQYKLFLLDIKDEIKNILKPYLLKNGVREIEIAFVSHLHKDHYDGIASLCREGMVRFLCLSESSRLLENEILEETGLLPSQLIYVKRGDRIFFEQEQVRMGNYRQKATETENEKRRSAEKRKEDGIVILSPEGQHEREYLRLLAEDDENQTSLIMKVELNGISVLMNGDISAEGERALLRDANCGKLNGLYRAETGNNVSADIAEGQSALTCTVLKAAHHGSKYSSCDEFIETVSPSAVIFQVGKNHYGHPDKSVIEKYRQKGIMIYRNDTDGAVGLICEKEKKDRRCGKRKAETGAALLFRVVTVRKDR